MNRFWNELEDIFERLDDINVEHKVDSIEDAENILNETIECDKEVETVFAQINDNKLSCWCEKERDVNSDVSGYSSHFEDDDEEDSDEDFNSSYDEDDSLLTSPSCSYVSFDHLPLPPSLDKTFLGLQELKITEL